LVGTTDSLSSKDPDDFSVSEAEIEELIDDLKGAYQLNSLSAKDVYFAFGGFRPLDRAIGRKLKKGVPIGNSAGVSRDDRIIDHAKPSTGKVRNLISVEGVKYTTFRSFAVKVVNMINRNSRIHNRRTRTHRDILPGGDTGNYSRYTERLHGILDQGFDSSVVDYLIENYGTDIEDVLVLASDRPELKELISKDPPCLGAEVVYLAQNEMVCHLSDIVLRRAGVGLTGCPQDDVLIRIAELAGAALGWTPERMAQEIQRTKADYARLGITA
jgi:glycerol-3-phosphate dehydrogenase